MSWFALRFGFSWLGAVYLALLFIPNGIFASSPPAEFSALSAGEPTVLVSLERTGQALACIFVVCTAKLQPGRSHVWLLYLAGILMGVYELWWIWYFHGPRTLESFYAPLLFIPVPGAVLPVAALLLLGIYAQSFWLLLSGLILGIGHIGIHVQHAVSLGLYG